MSLIPSQSFRISRHLVFAAVAAVMAGACSKSEPVVEPPPPEDTFTIGLAQKIVTVKDTINTGSPATLNIDVAATGNQAVSGLTVGSINFTGASGWLSAALSATSTPSTLSLTFVNSGLAVGTYTATVPVTSSAAATAKDSVSVTFTIDPTPPVQSIVGISVVAAGNIAQCGSGNNLAIASANAAASVNPQYVFAMGDNAYPPHGSPTGTTSTLADYNNCYGPNWGTFKTKTYAAVGGREQDSTGLSLGADQYYGPARVGDSAKNYFSFNIGTGAAQWHIIVLNILGGGPTVPIPYGSGSPQYSWLYNDLRSAANTSAKCTLAFWHDPMWMSSNVTSATDRNAGHRRQPQRGIWTLLYDANADVVLGGGDHIYERFAPMRYDPNTATSPEFAADSARGIRQFSSGLAGDGPTTTPTATTIHPLSEYRAGGNGALKLTLGDGEYTWEFINATNSNVIDSGYGRCH